ncbi:MAG: hypothetical protein ABIN37_17655 [Burkholderiaceae bacterium]
MKKSACAPLVLHFVASPAHGNVRIASSELVAAGATLPGWYEQTWALPEFDMRMAILRARLAPA